MKFRIIENLKDNWENFPMRYEIDPIRPLDTPPQKTKNGDFILYHGTIDKSAEEIIKTKTLKKDDIGSVGITTTPNEARKFARFKRNFGVPTILKLIIDKEWMAKQKISHEVGGTGYNEFLIRTDSIPSEAIKNIEIFKGNKFK